MRSFGKWTPFLISLVMTPAALILAVMSAGAGHGDYFVAKLLFPYTMLSTFVFDSITIPFLLLAIAQFPIYGFLLSIEKKPFATMMLLGLIHLVCVAAALLFVSENFS